jgi:NAD(P)-dependent dehydrogenase (short-subunit alcohol dehydrogenase family)
LHEGEVLHGRATFSRGNCNRHRIEGTRKHGTIINISSVHEQIPMRGAAGYDAAKGGLRKLTSTLALEFADKNINVNNVVPGMVLMPMNQGCVRRSRTAEKTSAGDSDEMGGAAGRDCARCAVPRTRAGALHSGNDHRR